MDGDIAARFAFEGRVFEWRGPAPFVFVAVPAEHVDEVRYFARSASYGWGVVPVEASVGHYDFTTSLFPKQDGYLLPLKLAVQKAIGVGIGDLVQVSVTLRHKLS